MRRTALLGFAVLALACAEAPPPPGAPGVPKPVQRAAAAPAKPGAPVDVRSTVAGDGVRLEIRFDSAGRDVSVSLRGTDGLVVLGDAQPVLGRRVGAGQTLVLEVGVQPAPGHSNLAVLVSGTFGGEARSRAASVGFGRLERDDVRALGRRDDGRGQPLRVGRGRIR